MEGWDENQLGTPMFSPNGGGHRFSPSAGSPGGLPRGGFEGPRAARRRSSVGNVHDLQPMAGSMLAGGGPKRRGSFDAEASPGSAGFLRGGAGLSSWQPSVVSRRRVSQYSWHLILVRSVRLVIPASQAPNSSTPRLPDLPHTRPPLQTPRPQPTTLLPHQASKELMDGHHGHQHSPSHLDQIPGLHGPFNGVTIPSSHSRGSSREASPRGAGHNHHNGHGHHGKRSPTHSPRTHHHHAGDLALGALHGPALDAHRVDKEDVRKMEQRLQVRDTREVARGVLAASVEGVTHGLSCGDLCLQPTRPFRALARTHPTVHPTPHPSLLEF